MAQALSRVGWSTRLALRAHVTSDKGDIVVTGSISRGTDWTRALDRVDAVVHLAANTSRKHKEADRQRIFETNASATLALAEAAAQSGIASFIFLSSIFVHGGRTDGRAPFRETDPLRPEDIYSESKAAAELALQNLSPNSGMAVTVVRPPIIYGRGSRANFGFLLRAIRASVPLPFALVNNRRAFVAAENLADFITFRILTGHTSDAFIVADDDQVSTAELARRVGAAAGKRAILLPVPPALLRTVCCTVGARRLAESTLSSLEVDAARARRAGWRPPLTMQQALARVLGETTD